MKQTNNAIKFLMAQYRAIFKNAYFKGLTSAVLLTAGLSVAGGAQAATTINRVDDLNQALTTDQTDQIVFDGDNYTLWITNDTASSSDAPEIINGDMIIRKGTTDAIHKIYASGAADTALYTQSSHDLLVEKNTTMQVGDSSSQSATNSTWNNISVEKGATFNVIGGSGASSFATATNAVTIDGATVNLQQQSGGGNAVLRGSTIDVLSDSVVNVGNIALESATLSSDNRAVLGWRAEQDGADGAITNGSNISFAADSTLNLNSYVSGSTSTTGQVWGNSLNMTSAFLNVKGTADSILNVHTTNLTNTQVVIDQGAELSITPLEVAQKNGTSYTDYYKNINGTVNINGGTMVVNGAMTLARGGSVTIGDDVQLTATAKATQDTAAGVDSGAIVIGFASGAVTSETLAGTTNPTLNISSKTLKDFVTATENLQYTLTNAEGTESKVTDGAGKLVLFDGARVNFTDTEQVEISDFKFGQTSTSGAANIWADLNYGDKLGANTGTDSLGEDKEQLDGNIRMFASNMSIAKSLLSDPQNNDNSSEDIYFDADSLTVGSEKSADGKWAGFDSTTSRIGVKGLKAKNDVTFIDGKGDTFYLQDTVTLERDFYTKDASGNYTTTATAPGLIKGDNLVIGGDSDSGTMTISGGAFVNEGQSLTISSGDLTVGAVANLDKAGTAVQGQGKDDHGDWTYYKNANPASLTWTGVFDIAGTAGTDDATISVKGASGATATLDLTGASVKWGSGSITLQGAVNTDNDPYRVSATDYFAVGGEGVLTITGNQFSDYLDIQTGDDTETATDLTISGGGVLLVEGAVTGAINFNKFSSTTSGAGTVYFNNGGRLVSTGELSLETGVATTVGGDPTTTSLDLGEGAIIAQGITINNRNPELDAADADLADDYVTVSGGALAVASRLATSNNEIKFNDASLVLDSNGFTRYGLSATEGGAVSAAKLTFSGDGSRDYA